MPEKLCSIHASSESNLPFGTYVGWDEEQIKSEKLGQREAFGRWFHSHKDPAKIPAMGTSHLCCF